jgi:hypothetical protein
MCGYWRGSQLKIKDIDESANRPGNVLLWNWMHLNGGGRNGREVMRGEKKKGKSKKKEKRKEKKRKKKKKKKVKNYYGFVDERVWKKK